MLPGKGHVGQDVFFRLVHQGGQLRQLGPDSIGHLPPLRACRCSLSSPAVGTPARQFSGPLSGADRRSGGDTVEDPDHRIEARDRLRPLIERVAVRFNTAGTRGVEIKLEGDPVALLNLGRSLNAPKTGAAGAAGLREELRSVKVGCGGQDLAFTERAPCAETD